MPLLPETRPGGLIYRIFTSKSQEVTKSRTEFDLENSKAQVELARVNLAAGIGVPISQTIRIIRCDDEDNTKRVDINLHDLIAGVMQTRQDMLIEHAIVSTKKDAIWTSSSNLLSEFVIGKRLIGNGPAAQMGISIIIILCISAVDHL
jgi:acyl-CoA hydrolase